MRLRPKILLMLTGVLAASLVGSAAIQRYAVYPRFVALERDEAMADWERARAAIDREIEHLSLLCLDWSSWTDTYNFARGTFPGYYDANIGKLEWFSEQALDVFYVCRPDGAVVWGQALDLSTLEPTTLSWLPGAGLPSDHPLLKVEDTKDSVVRGLVMTERGLMMFASRPILTSQNGGPRAGVLIFGRLLSDDAIASLRDQTHVDFTINTPSNPGPCKHDPEGVAHAMAALAPEIHAGSSALKVRGPLMDLSGHAIAVIQARVERHITQQGQAAMRFATLSLAGTGMLTLLMLIVGLRRTVLSPLMNLAAHASEIGASGNLHTRIAIDRDDEVGALAERFNEMVSRLEEYRTQAVEMSRQAGMAETATGVLHNVGNALTNANVVAETLAEKVARSKATSLSKAAAMMQEHRDDLGRFLSEDQRGKQIPAFLAQLAEHLVQENAESARDLESLRDGLHHIREIVAGQQDLARGSSVVEAIDVRAVVMRALRTVNGSMARHGIEVTVEGDDTSMVAGDRSKLQQVLVNLLTNAKDAIRSADGVPKRITVRFGTSDSRGVFIEVRDGGTGIHPEHMGKLFANGFSTKADGHGFGLHYSALAIGEMGGTVRAVSDGPGRGAMFRIELPAGSELVQEVAA